MLKRILTLVAVATAIAAPAAHATHIVEIDSKNISFFYDSDFWGVNQASVKGATWVTLTMKTKDFMQSSLTNSSATGPRQDSHVRFTDSTGIIAVPKNGYAVNPVMSASVTFSSQFNQASAGRGAGTVLEDIAVYSGTYANGVFTNSNGNHQSAHSAAGYGNSNTDLGTRNSTLVLGAQFSDYDHNSQYALGLRLPSFYDIYLYQQGLGSSALSIDQISFLFQLDNSGSHLPPPVPEPETYAMLLAGLGLLLGGTRRRAARR